MTSKYADFISKRTSLRSDVYVDLTEARHGIAASDHVHNEAEHGKIAAHHVLSKYEHDMHKADPANKGKSLHPKGADEHGLLHKGHSVDSEHNAPPGDDFASDEHGHHDKYYEARRKHNYHGVAEHNARQPKHVRQIKTKHDTHHIYATGHTDWQQGAPTHHYVVSMKNKKVTSLHSHYEFHDEDDEGNHYTNTKAVHKENQPHYRKAKHIHPSDRHAISDEIATHLHYDLHGGGASGDHIGYDIHNDKTKHIHKGDYNHPAFRSNSKKDDPGYSYHNVVGDIG